MDLEEAIQVEKERLISTYRRFPVLFVRGKGSRLWDWEGREYLDLAAGLGTCVLGHAHPAVAQAVAEEAWRLQHVCNLYYTEPQLRLAGELIVRSFPGRVFFCNSGTEANEAAIKLARKYMRQVRGEDRYVIVCALRAFHGRTLGSLAATGQPEKSLPFSPLPEGFVHVPYNDLAAVEEALKDPRVCAVMLEPIQGEAGVYPPSPEYLKGVERLCRERGILLILDEVQTGMGRTGELFAWQRYGVRPDVMTLAKGLANGLPIGAVVASSEVARALVPGDHGSTFGGNPIACAAGLATLRVLEEEALVENARAVGGYFRERLEGLVRETGPSSEVRGVGLMLAVEIGGMDSWEVALGCLRRGLVVNPVGPQALRFLPPLCLSQEEVDEAVDMLAAALEDARGK
ncbi:MAG: acetylornithine transaminase [Candidatus Geothermincolales bacterium]